MSDYASIIRGIILLDLLPFSLLILGCCASCVAYTVYSVRRHRRGQLPKPHGRIVLPLLLACFLLGFVAYRWVPFGMDLAEGSYAAYTGMFYYTETAGQRGSVDKILLTDCQNRTLSCRRIPLDRGVYTGDVIYLERSRWVVAVKSTPVAKDSPEYARAVRDRASATAVKVVLVLGFAVLAVAAFLVCQFDKKHPDRLSEWAGFGIALVFIALACALFWGCDYYMYHF